MIPLTLVLMVNGILFTIDPMSQMSPRALSILMEPLEEISHGAVKVRAQKHKRDPELCVVAHPQDPSIQEAEVG